MMFEVNVDQSEENQHMNDHFTHHLADIIIIFFSFLYINYRMKFVEQLNSWKTLK